MRSADAEAQRSGGSAVGVEARAGRRARYRHLAEIAADAMEQAPEHPCLVFRGQTWSNGAVDRWSRFVAGAILARTQDGGTGRVGLLVERGPALVTGLLAIFRADRTAVLCDPSQAEGRTRTILADADPDLVLVDDAEDGARFGIPPDRLIAIGRPDAALAERESLDGVPGDGTRPAYILYTSGSTGRPKGVVCGHAGLCNLVEHPPWDGPLPSGSRLLVASPVTFDPVVYDILLALRHGLTLVLADQGEVLSGPDLADLMRREAVSIADLPPGLLSAIPPGPLPDLRIVITGGETCPQAVVDEWAPRVALHNCYGPTETTVEVMRWRWSAGEPGRRIGRPIPNVVARVVDPAGADAEEGELQIGGPMVAPGYLGMPEMTAARFFACSETGLQFFRTGDRVRCRDGVYEFLGRLDDQIKISGVRVEPEEVRAAIEALAGVAEAAITVQDVDGHVSLAGFYGPGSAPEPAALLEELGQRLLPAMIPARLVKLDAIPRLTSGKADLDALRRLVAPPRDPHEEDAQVVPLSETGTALAALWRKLLDRGSVRPTDNFFAMGGDSLRLTQMIFAINQAYRVKLTPSIFRGLPDLGALIAYVELRSAGAVAAPHHPVPQATVAR